MKTRKNPHIGSDFDDFLREQGILEQVERASAKKLIALELHARMEGEHISKLEMARRLKTSRSQLDRLLDPANESVTLATLDRAAQVLGKRLRVTLEDLPA
jgi:antitoxin HicB